MISVPESVSINSPKKTVVVIGNGMVGLRFCEKLVEFDKAGEYRIVTFCEEPRAAYDRVGLTSFFAHRDAEKLMLAKLDWYAAHGVELHLGDRADVIDRERCQVTSQKGVVIPYDNLVMATGSIPFVPPVPGVEKAGVFVYRTIEDLERIIAYSKNAKRCAVLGGGLLGLEAAKAVYDLGLEAHVIEYNGRLMPRQIDDAGSRVLVGKLESLGVHVHLNCSAKAILGNGCVEELEFSDGTKLEVDMIVVSTGIRPRDDLARQCGLDVGQRGGIVVDDRLTTSDRRISAIGECALHGGMVYGLVAPGYDMAETLATLLTGGDRRFNGADLSTKLKLMGVDVASFGDYEAGPEKATPLFFENPFGGEYKKLLFSKDGKTLLGGILVGDASQYGTLSMLAKSGAALPCKPHELIVGSSGGAPLAGGIDGLPDSAQVCSCNNVSKGAICSAIRDQNCDSPAAVKSCTKAGAGCGGCFPLVTDLFKAEMKKLGKSVTNHLCEHFAYSRTELFAIVKTKQLRTFSEVLKQSGTGHGCETCKPAIASILASLWNENVLDAPHESLQDTNDRFLANIQRGGSYSVVPRVPGGEITPEKLIVIGEVAREFNLYTKITGGQRIDLFGAQVHELPEIWERLVENGFESGHAYGKSLRTVKSCVGSTWCRYGVRDSVGFAIEIENRYKGIRSPHKIKMAVSGCTRECAEAQSKDVGLIAVEGGYNVYVCGNGGTKPRHAELLAACVDEATAIKYVDRFLMYYISTADKLMRTSTWCEKLEGGIEHIRDVVVHDKLGIAAELEQMLQRLVDTYQCEWAAVVKDPEKRKRFRQFMNSDETESCIEVISQRGQLRPADWPGELVSLEQFQSLPKPAAEEVEVDDSGWVQVGVIDDFPMDAGATIKYGKTQIAVFNFASRGEWYASQNMCPHKKAFVLARGIVGDQKGEPKVACPLHKKTFSLKTGESLSDAEYSIETFPVKVEGSAVCLRLPPVEVLDERHATEIGCALASSCLTHRNRELVEA
ncbi:Nitrite reductase [NAD(P)H] [Caulifigura coniformis]|uniref:Nitrite reductase [NAD(P)H] n=1 Tax=Caulifigura coniformis TaxID=2527983 RepID=A0A517SJ63_9PLAN|nr:nitrite reductase large subunit NirB [Caulifigura coniformis]QDT56162.1 Nitrite reductase [NAD(P)H] [Caulifigura coniformis]